MTVAQSRQGWEGSGGELSSAVSPAPLASTAGRHSKVVECNADSVSEVGTRRRIQLDQIAR